MHWNSTRSFTLSGLAANRYIGKHNRHLAILLLSVAVLIAPTQLGFVAQQPPAGARRAARKLPVPAQPAARAEQPKFKAIWEPVNYPDDYYLSSVFFVSEKVGWAGGGARGWNNAGVLIHTADGGEHWDLQLGDPESSQAGFQNLYFLDATHGWVTQGDNFLRTSDGLNWEQAGSLPTGHPMRSYVFTSPATGIAITTDFGGSQSSVFVTRDGGSTWNPTWACNTAVQVNGLTNKVGCPLNALHFISPTVGYAVGGNTDLVQGRGFVVVAKTEDGGATWRVIFSSTDDFAANGVFFIDENTGYMRVGSTKLLATSDGGRTWHGVPTPVPDSGRILFADPEVGWICGYRSVAFSGDSGHRWNSRDFHFPVDVYGWSFPRRDRAYVVGQHGMVYRYRIAPIDYKVANMIDAPMMPGYNLQPIQADLQNLRQRIQAFQAKLQAAQTQAGGLQATAALAPATSSDAAQNAAAVPADASAQPTVAGGFSQDASAGGAFTQDTLVAGGFTQSTADSGTQAQTPDGGGGFVQDTGPSSGFIQSCCSADVQNLQYSMGVFTQNISAFTTKYRTLNLILTGINLFSELMAKSQGLRTSFHTLRTSRDAQSAIAALSQLSAFVNDMGTTAISRFQGQSSYGLMPTQAPAAFQQQAPFPQ